jgi:catechol-2,3-dioxygenase
MSTQTNGNPAAPTPRISHMVLRTTCLKEMIDWYTTVFNAKVLFQSDFGAFLTYDDEHHRIALFAIPGVTKKAKNSSGLDHVAFIYPSFAAWITTYERLKAIGITPRATMHHGITMSLYYRDPDDNGIELGLDNVDKAGWIEWMETNLGKTIAGGPLDPEDLARRFHAGEAESELRQFHPRAQMDPEFIRAMME